MPWSEKQQATARAVLHDWKPTGSAKGFDRKFARQVLAESDKKRKRESVADLIRRKS